MSQEQKKVIKLFCTNASLDILTKMPEKEIIEEIECINESVRDLKWIKLEGCNTDDERTPLQYLREDVRGFIIVPFHPAQAQRPTGIVTPRIVQ